MVEVKIYLIVTWTFQQILVCLEELDINFTLVYFLLHYSHGELDHNPINK